MVDTQAPPAFANRPQFTPEYWAKVPRQVVKAQIERVTNKDDTYVEIVLKGGLAFLRKRAEIKTLLTANTVVNVETIKNGAMITGVFVPSPIQGPGGQEMGQWAFRMTNEDLAEYTKKLSAHEHARQKAIRENMVNHIAAAMLYGIDEVGLMPTEDEDTRNAVAKYLAGLAIEALEQGPDNG